MKDKSFRNERSSFSSYLGDASLAESLAKEAEDDREKRKSEILSIACLVLGKGSLSTADERVAKFIDNLFSQDENLAKAWVAPAFPFQELNDIYKSLVGNDHPIFLELFGSSFSNGFFQAKAEETGGVTNASAAAITYLSFAG